MDEFDFDPSDLRESLSSYQAPSVGSKSDSRANALASLRRGSGKTKSARLERQEKRRQQEVGKGVRFCIDDSERDSVDSAIFSNRSSPIVRNRKQKSCRRYNSSDESSLKSQTSSICSSMNDLKENRSSLSSTSLRSSLSSLDCKNDSGELDDEDDRIQVKGSGLSVLAVQDAGSHRMLLDECLYLASTICAADKIHINRCTRTINAALWDLASILSTRQNRKILWSALETSLDPILSVFKTIPNFHHWNVQQPNQPVAVFKWDEGTETNPGASNETHECASQEFSTSAYEALSCIMYFLSQDCTTAPSSASSNVVAARKLRHRLLRCDGALHGMSSLMIFTPSSPPDEKLTLLQSMHPKSSSSDDLAHLLDARESVASCAGSVTTASLDASIEELDHHPQQSTSSAKRKFEDPTSVGRRNRQRLRRRMHRPLLKREIPLTPIVGDCLSVNQTTTEFKAGGRDPLSFTDTDETPPQRRPFAAVESVNDSVGRVADAVKSKISWNQSRLQLRDNRERSRVFVRTVATEAIHRIVQAKETGDEMSSFDVEFHDVEVDDDDGAGGTSNDNDCATEASNPLLATNELLFESGVLPIFAMVMAESLSELYQSPACADDDGQFQCTFLISAIANLIDGACLLSDKNREELCRSGALINSLLSFLCRTLELSDAQSSEITLVSMRTLTSLTHENALAGEQLMQILTIDNEEQTLTKRMSGVDILLHLLYRAVINKEGSMNNDRSRLEYDVTIFCLNTLTNMVESSNTHKFSLSAFNVTFETSKTEECKIPFVAWLTRWIIDETSTFRESVLNGCFGNTPKTIGQNNCKDTYLDKGSEEHLVTAGNGLILLACFIIKGETSIQESILLDLTSVGGYRLIINTLKAFCNFYYYSVGDLSVAVVSPVRKIISELERIAVMQKNRLSQEMVK